MLTQNGFCGGDQHGKELLEHILFTDESIIELFPKPNSQNTRIRTSNPSRRQPISIPKNGLKIMVAGGLSASGLTELHIVEHGATVNAAYYREKILPIYISSLPATTGDIADRRNQHCLFQEAHRVIFMQDGAPAHTANATLSFISSRFSGIWSKGIWVESYNSVYTPVKGSWQPKVSSQDGEALAPRPVGAKAAPWCRNGVNSVHSKN